MNEDLKKSLKRTLVPVWTAWVVMQGARVGVDLPGDAVADLILALVTSAYYAVVRVAEAYYPGVSRLLGDSEQPFYYPVEKA